MPQRALDRSDLGAAPAPALRATTPAARAGAHALSRTVSRALRSAVSCAVLGLAIPALAPAQDRTLSWPAVTVEAHLDSTGRLTVREREVLLFSGGWNGGERRFNVRSGQSLSLTALTRIDAASGQSHLLVEGDIDQVDGFAWSGDHVLRWRSRLSTDPPFNRTALTYELAYTVDGILQPGTDGQVVLDHDFAFADRPASIDTFRLTLTVDPIWGTPAGFTGRHEGGRLEPGSGFVVTLPLTWRGNGTAPGVFFGADSLVRLVILGVLLAGLLGLAIPFVAHERAQQRFAPLTALNAIDIPWIEANVLAHLPEVVGAAWDARTGASEVAATLARLVVEGKLSSRVEATKVWSFTRQVLHLELTVDRNALEGHERTLVDSLFDGKATRTDTDAVRRRYEARGFDPAERIRSALASRFNATPGAGHTLKAPSPKVTLALAVIAVALLVAGLVQHVDDLELVLFGTLAATVVGGIALSQAFLWRARVWRPELHALRFVVPLAALVTTLSLALTDRLMDYQPLGEPVTWAGLVFLCLAVTSAALDLGRARENADRFRMRKRFAAARRWFARELTKPAPALRDPWYPYLIALGLGPRVDRWFRAFGTESDLTQATGRTMSGIGSSDASPSSGTGWTGFGGGGGFSGGGSGASFASAVGGMASAVAAPSSSSSGGSSGSSSSGGSSGGGGGGGW